MRQQLFQTLLIDADDTLWENNIHFERVIRTVQDLLAPYKVSPEAFRNHLNELEKEHIKTHGYGTVNFTRSLVGAFESFLPPKADPAIAGTVKRLGLAIMEHPLEVIEGVPETLDYLQRRHRLFLVTKGNLKEQNRKIEKSGLRKYFQGVEILAEKNVGSYEGLVRRYAWDPDRTWMIGNSPRSDVNPALEAGLRSVYIPHNHTWVLEHEEPARRPGLLELRAFPELRLHF